MIDYLKILVKNPNIELLESNHELDFKGDVSKSTGEDSEKDIALYHHCKIIKHKSGTILFSGSIHKMYNSLKGTFAPNYQNDQNYKGYNGNQFTYQNIEFIKQHLLVLFGVQPEDMVIQNIEFGQNLNTSFNPQKFIEWLLLLETKPFEHRYSERYAQSVHQQYILKVYNKGTQYGMPDNSLRFEIKVLKMKHQINEVGITNLADINRASIEKSFQYLKKHLLKLLYYDITIDKKTFSKRLRNKLDQYNNPKYWQSLNAKERSRNKSKLNILIKNHSQNLRSEILLLLDKNWVQFNRHSETTTWAQFNHSSIVLNNTHQPQRFCPITGHDISMQKPTSTMLSNTGLRYYEKHKPELFARLKRKLLTGRENKFEKDIYSMMSKQIRNRYYNRPPINPNQIGLF